MNAKLLITSLLLLLIVSALFLSVKKTEKRNENYPQDSLNFEDDSLENTKYDMEIKN